MLDTVQWSDGVGQVETTCLVCNGTGIQPTPDEIMALRRRADAAEARLHELRTHVALFLGTNDKGTATPWPPLRDATGPSRYRRTWRERLERAAQCAPRFTEEEFVEYCGGGDEGRLMAAWNKSGCRVGFREFVAQQRG
jgi:hypothetical protein